MTYQFKINIEPKDLIEEIDETDLKNIIANRLVEYKKGKTKKINFSRPIHEQLIKN